MENRYTDSVKNAWKFAAEEASKLGSEYVGTEHLLIGISNEKDSGRKDFKFVGTYSNSTGRIPAGV